MVKFNGKEFEWEENQTVRCFLDKHGYTFFSVLILNGKVLPPKEFDSTYLKDNDVLNGIHMHGGG